MVNIEVNMNKLEIITNSLETNSDVIIVKRKEDYHLRYWGTFIDFYIAPVKGLYKPGELNLFMRGLIPPSLTPDSKNDFIQTESRLHFGNLFFNEIYAIERKFTRSIIKPVNESIENLRRCLHWSYSWTIEDGMNENEIIIYHSRAIYIHLFPTEEIAKDIQGIYKWPHSEKEFIPQNKDYISLKNLENYKPISFKKLLKKLIL